MDHLVNLERRETEVYLDLRALQVARENLALLVDKVHSVLLVLQDFLVLKDRKDLRDQLVQLARKGTLD